MHTKQSYKWCWGILVVNAPCIIISSIPELHFWTNWMPSSFLNPIVLQSRSLLCISPRLDANQFLCGWWSAQVSDQNISKLFFRKACTINAGMVKVLLYSICPQCPLFHVAKIMKFRWRGKTQVMHLYYYPSLRNQWMQPHLMFVICH
jgi:hypothetical protein